MFTADGSDIRHSFHPNSSKEKKDKKKKGIPP